MKHKGSFVSTVGVVGLLAVLAAAPATASDSWSDEGIETEDVVVSQRVYRTDDSIFPDDLEPGESRTVSTDGATTVYTAITASCTVSMTVSTPYLWLGDYARSNVSASIGSGCSGKYNLDARLYRHMLIGWKQENYSGTSIYPGWSWSTSVRAKCRNNSLQVEWQGRGYINNGLVQSRAATLACRM